MKKVRALNPASNQNSNTSGTPVNILGAQRAQAGSIAIPVQNWPGFSLLV